MYLAIYICVGEETHVPRRKSHTWRKGKTFRSWFFPSSTLVAAMELRSLSKEWDRHCPPTSGKNQEEVTEYSSCPGQWWDTVHTVPVWGAWLTTLAILGNGMAMVQFSAKECGENKTANVKVPRNWKTTSFLRGLRNLSHRQVKLSNKACPQRLKG